MVGGRTGCFLQEQHSSAATQVMLHPSAPSHSTVPSGPQLPLRSNDAGRFCLQGAPATSLWLADAQVLQQKPKWAWKETMSLTLEDVMFSTSLSHQWMYEPGEEFPETSCMQWFFKMWISEKSGRRKSGECHLSPAVETLHFTVTVFCFSHFGSSLGIQISSS